MTRKTKILLVVKSAVSLTLMGLIARQLYPKLPALIALSREVNVPILLAGVALQFTVTLLWALRQKVLLHSQGVRLPYAEVMSLTFISAFFNNILPGASGGDVVRGYLLCKKAPDRKAEALAVLFFDRLMGVFTLSIIALVSLLSFYSDTRFRPVLRICLLMIAFMTAGCAMLVSRRVAGRMAFLKACVPSQRILGFLRQFQQALFLFRSRLRALATATALSFGLQLVSIFSVVAFGVALHISQIGLQEYLLVIPIGFFINALPISIGGWGVGEVAFISLLGVFHVPEERAFSMGLLFHLACLFTGLVGAAFYLLDGARFRASEPEPGGKTCERSTQAS